MANKTYLDKTGLSYFWGKIKTALNGKANTSDIPTKTSDLTNDSGFTTAEVNIGTTTPSNNEKLWIKSDETTNQGRYYANGSWNELSIKALDSMPLGTIVDYDGQVSDIPAGWEEDSNILYTNTNGTSSNIELNDDIVNYSFIEFVAINKDGNTETYSTFKFDTSKTIYNMSGVSIGASSYNLFTKSYSKGTTTSGKTTLTANTGRVYSSTGSYSNYEVFQIIKVIGYK